jgi:hypothetical protein
MLTDPLSVECPACGARPGENCWGLRALGRGAYVAATPHKTRIALAPTHNTPTCRTQRDTRANDMGIDCDCH